MALSHCPMDGLNKNTLPPTHTYQAKIHVIVLFLKGVVRSGKHFLYKGQGCANQF